LPPADFVTEVAANLPLHSKLQDVTRRLGRRQSARSVNRVYPPTILELVTLVNRNPEKPRGHAWDSIMALNMRYDLSTEMVTIEYCVDHCGARSQDRRV